MVKEENNEKSCIQQRSNFADDILPGIANDGFNWNPYDMCFVVGLKMNRETDIKATIVLADDFARLSAVVFGRQIADRICVYGVDELLNCGFDLLFRRWVVVRRDLINSPVGKTLVY